jgi:hypothetical protein
VVGAAGVLALAAAGCGAESHPNEPRPQVSLHVSVTIGPRQVIVQPGEVATGGAPTQQIPQNKIHQQPRIEKARGPIDVTFVVANQTARDSTVQILRQSQLLKDTKVFAHSPETIQTALPSGTYTVAAAGIPGARPGKLVVGDFRASSENDVLLP